MHLTELALHNVGPYRGRQHIALATRPGKPVVLIGGLNGCGKTTFLDALQLALYGNRAQLSNRGSQGYEEYLGSMISRGVSPKDGASVSVSFTVHAEGLERTYQVTRSWAASGKRVKESLDVVVDGEWDRILSTTWADHVEDLLPLDIAGLFFFDGEKIEALADPERAATVIQTAIHSLLGASTIEQLRTDLVALQRRQVPDSGDAALEQELLDVLDEHTRLQAELAATRGRRDEAHHLWVEALAEMQAAEQAFSADGGDVFSRRMDLEARKAGLGADLASAQSQLRALAEGILPLGLLADSLEAATKSAAAEQSAEDSQRLVRLLESRDEWLVAQLPDQVKSAVDVILATDRTKRSIGTTASNTLGLSAGQASELSAAHKALPAQQKAAKTLIARLRELQEDLAQVEGLLGQIPDDARIEARMSTRDATRAAFARLDGQRQVLDEDIAKLARDTEAVESRLAKVEARRIQTGVTNDDKRRIVEHADRVRATLAEMREKLIRRNIGRIEIATLDSFRRLMRKSGLVADLRIDPTTYTLQLTTESGDSLSPNRLSAGERQLLAVALLWGLARVAGNQLPTVIDTPLGRLDSIHRKHLVDRYFPNASHQVLLLSTDEEIDAGLLPDLAPYISASYLLVHDADQDRTSIEPGYWWELEASDVA